MIPTDLIATPLAQEGLEPAAGPALPCPALPWMWVAQAWLQGGPVTPPEAPLPAPAEHRPARTCWISSSVSGCWRPSSFMGKLVCGSNTVSR